MHEDLFEKVRTWKARDVINTRQGSSMIHSASPQSRPAAIVAWFWSFGTDGRTETLCENSDHYGPGLWSASWINLHMLVRTKKEIAIFQLLRSMSLHPLIRIFNEKINFNCLQKKFFWRFYYMKNQFVLWMYRWLIDFAKSLFYNFSLYKRRKRWCEELHLVDVFCVPLQQ